MEKLQLNKRTIAQMDRMQMRNVKGGASFPLPCVISCAGPGSRALKRCCARNHPDAYKAELIRRNPL